MFAIHAYIVFTALGSLAFLALARRGYRRDTKVRALPAERTLRAAA